MDDLTPGERAIYDCGLSRGFAYGCLFGIVAVFVLLIWMKHG